MKNLFLIPIIFCLTANVAKAQFLAASEVHTGVPMTSKALDKNNEDSPYLYNETFKGTVSFEDGKKNTENLNLLYDLKADIPMFINENGNFMKFNELPIEFSFIIPGKRLHIYKRGFPAIDTFKEKDFYEVLSEGKILLLKKTKKSFTESIPYGTSQLVKKAVYAEFYYIYDGKTMKRSKKDPKTLIRLLGSPDLDNYYRKVKDNFSTNEEALISIVEKYNEKS